MRGHDFLRLESIECTYIHVICNMYAEYGPQVHTHIHTPYALALTLPLRSQVMVRSRY